MAGKEIIRCCCCDPTIEEESQVSGAGESGPKPRAPGFGNAYQAVSRAATGADQGSHTAIADAGDGRHAALERRALYASAQPRSGLPEQPFSGANPGEAAGGFTAAKRGSEKECPAVPAVCDAQRREGDQAAQAVGQQMHIGRDIQALGQTLDNPFRFFAARSVGEALQAQVVSPQTPRQKQALMSAHEQAVHVDHAWRIRRMGGKQIRRIHYRGR